MKRISRSIRNVITNLSREQKIYHQLSSTTCDYTFVDLLTAIKMFESPEELIDIEFVIDNMTFDGHFTQDELFTLHSTIASMYRLLIYIDDHFPHDYYPPFAIEGHIAHAETEMDLNAIALHLRFNEKKYQELIPKQQFVEYLWKVLAAKKRLKIQASQL